eukprot:10829565-Ditylum_brightwellii.AAC.1
MKYWLKVYKPLIRYCLKVVATQRKKQEGDIKKFIQGASRTEIPHNKTQTTRKKKKNHALAQTKKI